MNEIAEYERRISAALSRIAYGIETLQARPVALDVTAEMVAADVVDPDLAALDGISQIEAPIEEAPIEESAIAEVVDTEALENLRAELEGERAANNQLSERVRAIREKQETTLAALERKLGQASRTNEAATGEIARLKRVNADLVEINAALLDAAGDVESHLVNRAMQAELEALRAARSSDAQELAELMAALEPLAALVETADPQEEPADA